MGTSKKKWMFENLIESYFFLVTYLKKVKLSYILEPLHEKYSTSKVFCFNFDD